MGGGLLYIMGFGGLLLVSRKKEYTNIVPREICEEIKVETVLKQKRLQRAK